MASVSVNKAEMAGILSCSVPTLDKLIDRHGDNFPIMSRGGRGVEWKFDPEAVVEFLRRMEAEAVAAGQARDAVIEQFMLPGVAQEAAGVSPADMLRLAQVRRLETDQAIRAGFLIEVAALRPKFEDAFSKLRRESAAAIRSTLTDNAIPETIIRTIESRVNEAWNRAIDAVQRALANESDEPEQRSIL